MGATISYILPCYSNPGEILQAVDDEILGPSTQNQPAAQQSLTTENRGLMSWWSSRKEKEVEEARRRTEQQRVVLERELSEIETTVANLKKRSASKLALLKDPKTTKAVRAGAMREAQDIVRAIQHAEREKKEKTTILSLVQRTLNAPKQKERQTQLKQLLNDMTLVTNANKANDADIDETIDTGAAIADAAAELEDHNDERHHAVVGLAMDDPDRHLPINIGDEASLLSFMEQMAAEEQDEPESTQDYQHASAATSSSSQYAERDTQPPTYRASQFPPTPTDAFGYQTAQKRPNAGGKTAFTTNGKAVARDDEFF